MAGSHIYKGIIVNIIGYTIYLDRTFRLGRDVGMFLCGETLLYDVNIALHKVYNLVVILGVLILQSSTLCDCHIVEVYFNSLCLYAIDDCRQYQRVLPQGIPSLSYAMT